MIPSNNDPKITADAFAVASGNCPRWTCDCCQRSYEQDWLKEVNEPGIVVPIFVEVNGIKYFACSKDCARILFSIHHQYALREVSQENRFVDLATQFDPLQPNILDLDAVVQMGIEEYRYPTAPMVQEGADMAYLVWWTAQVGEKKSSPLLGRHRAKEILELWKSRSSGRG